MSSSRLFADPDAALVPDASGIINLNGTGRAADILKIIPHRVVIASQVMIELENGRKSGHDDADKLMVLRDRGLVEVRALDNLGQELFEALVSGSALQTLDDGEAATIACAIELAGIALMDERKAINLCASTYPSLELVSTSALLLNEMVAAHLGAHGQAEAIFSALRASRMRVPAALVETIVGAIGHDRAALCRSLPSSARHLGVFQDAHDRQS